MKRQTTLNQLLASHDQAKFLEELRHIAGMIGMTKVTRATGCSENLLYVSLSAKGNPKLSTLLSLLDALGLKLQVVPVNEK